MPAPGVYQDRQPTGGPGEALQDRPPQGRAKEKVPLRPQDMRAQHDSLLPPRPLPRPPAHYPHGRPRAARQQGRRRVVGIARHAQQLVEVQPLPPPRQPRQARLRLPSLRHPVRKGTAGVSFERRGQTLSSSGNSACRRHIVSATLSALSSSSRKRFRLFYFLSLFCVLGLVLQTCSCSSPCPLLNALLSSSMSFNMTTGTGR